MKTCPYCKIEVGGNVEKCPLCQSKLTGGEGEAYFPARINNKITSFFFRVQKFVAWVIIIAAFGLDFLFKLRIPAFPDVHYSLIIAMWVIAFEYVIMKQFQRGTGSARNMTVMVFLLLGMLAITANYFGFMRLVMFWIVPITITAMMIANFVLALVDRQGNAMAYLLTNLLVGALPYVVMHFMHTETPTTWIICLLVSVVLFAGAIIFKGRAVAAELRRRLNM